MNDDIISRSAAIRNLMLQPTLTKSVVRRVLMQTKNVDIKTGKWIFDAGVDYCYKCSECDAMKPPHYIYDNYCPKCGAKMME